MRVQVTFPVSPKRTLFMLECAGVSLRDDFLQGLGEGPPHPTLHGVGT